MHFLNWLDYLIILGYLALSVVAGVWMSRRASKSIDNYFLGGRTLPWYMLGIAGMAGWFDLTGTMIITSFLYMLGPRGLYVEFRGGACLILAFMIAYTGKWHRRSGCMTAADWMTYRFGISKAAEGLRFLTALIAIISAIMMIAYLIRGASLFLGMFFPYPPFWTTLILLCLTTFYTMGSGFYGVVLTDMVQGVIVIFASLTIAFMAWHLVPSTESLAATAAQVTGNLNWTDTQISVHTTMPPGYEPYESLLMVASFYLLRNVLGGLGTGGESRYFGARSDRDCGLQSVLQGAMVAFRWPLMMGFAVLGIYLVKSLYTDPTQIQQAAAVIHSFYPQLTEANWHDTTSAIVNGMAAQPPHLVDQLQAVLGTDWRGKLPMVGFHGTINPEQILPAVLLNDVPSGLKGALVVALLAAMMSCKNGTVNGASAYFVKDIYQNFLRPKATNRELIFASYGSTFGVAVLGFYFGVIATSINDLWSWIVMSLTAGSLAPGMLRLYWWRCNAWGMVSGLLLGLIGSILQRIFLPHLLEWEQFVAMTSLSFAGTIIGSLVTEPTPMATLQHFYRTTRPFGIWGPLRGEFKGADREAVDRENRSDLMSVPFGMVWTVTLFLLPMELVIKAYSAFWTTLPLFIIAIAGMYWFWWRNLFNPAHPKDASVIEEKGPISVAEEIESLS
jgi:solute:Na+ symporter, SSS family